MMRLSSTTTQRTYRYVRLAILGAVLSIGVALVIVLATEGPLTSLSGLFYTSGRTAFTGALIAVALALVALSGHSVEQILLDVAALFAPLIAVIPTPVALGDLPGETGCPGAVPCVPEAFVPGVTTGIITFAVMAIVGAGCALILARVQQTLSPGVLIGVIAAGVVAVVMLVWLLVWPDALLHIGHLVVTAAFFGIMVAIAVVSAAASRRPWRRVYVIVAVGMATSLLYLAIVGIVRLTGVDLSGQPWTLVGEIGVIGFFAVFWVAQTVQKWNEVDPSLVAR